MRIAPAIELTNEQQNRLAKLVRSKRTSVRLAQRAHIVLLAAQGIQNTQIAEQLGIGRVQVARWRERYLEAGLEGIERDLPRGAPPVKVDVAKLVELTTQTTPEAEHAHDGRGYRSQRQHRHAALASAWPQASFGSPL